MPRSVLGMLRMVERGGECRDVSVNVSVQAHRVLAHVGRKGMGIPQSMHSAVPSPIQHQYLGGQESRHHWHSHPECPHLSPSTTPIHLHLNNPLAMLLPLTALLKQHRLHHLLHS